MKRATKRYEFDGGYIEYYLPVYTDVMRIFARLNIKDLEKLQSKSDDSESDVNELDNAEQLEIIADSLDSIHNLIVSIKFKEYTSTSLALSDMAIMPHMIEVFKDIMSMINQNSEAQKARKK